MDQRLKNFYLETQVNSATPGQLLIMLYDGLIQQAETAVEEMAAADPSLAARAVSRCIDIMTELSGALKPEVDAQLCATLGELYRFFMKEFSEALTGRDSRRIGKVLPLIRELRAAWFQADKKANPFRAAVAA